MALSDLLGTIPGRGAYLAQQEFDQRQGAGQLAQLLGVANFVEQTRDRQMRQQAQQQVMAAREEELKQRAAQSAALDAHISTLPPQQQLLARLNPQEFVKSMTRNEESKVVPPGAALIQGGREVYLNPRAEKDNRHSFEKLLDAAGITDPQKRAQIVGQYIGKQSTHAPAVNVYSSSLTPGVDAQGQPVFVQPSARADTPPRVVEGVYPAPRAGADKDRKNSDLIAGEYDAADQLISNMIRSIQSNRMSVGVPGMAGQAVETVTGTVQPGVQTPAIDLQSQKEMLISKLKGLSVRKDSNYSNKDAERDEKSMGLDKMFTTPEAAVRALTSVQNDLRRKRASFVSSAPRQESGPRAGSVENGYRFKGGDPAKPENWEKM